LDLVSYLQRCSKRCTSWWRGREQLKCGCESGVREKSHLGEQMFDARSYLALKNHWMKEPRIYISFSLVPSSQHKSDATLHTVPSLHNAAFKPTSQTLLYRDPKLIQCHRFRHTGPPAYFVEEPEYYISCELRKYSRRINAPAWCAEKGLV
jgi:hypothetical protein